MRLLLTAIITFTSFIGISQVISGRIIDADSKNPIGYVNIGVVGKNRGTVSNKDGQFSLEVKPENYKDTLRLSTIGYQPVNFIVEDINRILVINSNGLVIELSKYIPVLTEVIITPRKFKKKVIGYKGKLGHVVFDQSMMADTGLFNSADDSLIIKYLKDTSSCSEWGTVLEIKKAPAYIQDINFVIKSNKYKNTILFRLNIYEKKEGFHGNNILHRILTEPIIVSSTIEKGILKIDLAKYNIYVENDFLVAMEWVEGVKGVGFGAGLKGISIGRICSWGSTIQLNFSLGIYATVLYLK